jgi:Integrase core domain
VFAAEAIKVFMTPVWAPRANASAERWVGTVRREVLDRMLIVGCRQLRSVLADYVDHYNGHRAHRALGQAPPLRPGVPVVVAPPGRVVRRDRLGGLIHEYAQVAHDVNFNIWHPQGLVQGAPHATRRPDQPAIGARTASANAAWLTAVARCDGGETASAFLDKAGRFPVLV